MKFPSPRARLFVVLPFLVLIFSPASRAAEAQAPALNYGTVQLMDRQIQALQPTMGDPQAMARTLATLALAPQVAAGSDAAVAAMMVKGALTDPRIFVHIKQNAATRKDPAVREMVVNLERLRKSVAGPKTPAVFDREMANVQKKLAGASLRSADDMKAALDAMFAGAPPATSGKSDGVLAQTAAPGEDDGKIHLALAKPSAAPRSLDRMAESVLMGREYYSYNLSAERTGESRVTEVAEGIVVLEKRGNASERVPLEKFLMRYEKASVEQASEARDQEAAAKVVGAKPEDVIRLTREGDIAHLMVKRNGVWTQGDYPVRYPLGTPSIENILRASKAIAAVSKQFKVNSRDFTLLGFDGETAIVRMHHDDEPLEEQFQNDIQRVSLSE